MYIRRLHTGLPEYKEGLYLAQSDENSFTGADLLLVELFSINQPSLKTIHLSDILPRILYKNLL